jgi:SAM-dependent methyltransferase
MTFSSIEMCRSCGNPELFPVLDLGDQPLANALVSPAATAPEARYPLRVVGCAACSLVQLSGTVDPAVMFDRYAYFSSYSTSMVDAMGTLAARTIEEEGLSGQSLVVEVASNDGYLLQHYIARGVPVQGVDPAANVAEVATARGIPTRVEYFGRAAAARLIADVGPANVLHANNVLAHVPDVNDFVAGMATALARDGLALIETPHIISLIARCEFDTIYHEHVFYYSLTALEALFQRHGLAVERVELLGVHGGSLRLALRHADRLRAVDPSVESVRKQEQDLAVGSPAYYADFASEVSRLRVETVSRLADLHGRGARLAGYGAAAKGTVLLNAFGIDGSLLEYVVDRNEHKQGLLVPGVRLPIRAPDVLLSDRPDYVVLLAWNLADEIIGQQQEYLAAGGSFIVPVPTFRLVTR